MFINPANIWPDIPVRAIHTEAMDLWLLLRTNCRLHGAAPCPCDYRIGTPADDLLQALAIEEADEYARLEFENPDIAAVLPW